MKTKILLYFILAVSCTYAQSMTWEGELSIAGQSYSETAVPFWMQANTATRFGSETQFSGMGMAKGSFDLTDNSKVEFGASLFVRDGVEDEVQRGDLYAQFENSWLRAIAGAKSEEVVTQGLSLTNKNFLLSGNARPLGGVHLEASNPLKVSETFSFDWAIGHYFVNDDRFVDNVWLHHKRLALITQFNENHKLTAQLQHYVQWGGTSPIFGDLPDDLGAFIDVFFASNAPEVGVEGEIANAVGNHLGAYLLDYEFKTKVGEFSLYHEHPFEDGSGMRLSNLPDGIWGLYFKPEKDTVIKGALYEYVTTNDQSVTTPNGEDNYFSNGVYRSGWSYDGVIIGMPFILYNPNLVINATNSPIVSNRVKAHHFGLLGTVHHIDWMIKSSIVQQLGTFNNPFDPVQNFWHNYLSLEYDSDSFGKFRIYGAVDSGDAIDTNFGGGLEYTYSFN